MGKNKEKEKLVYDLAEGYIDSLNQLHRNVTQKESKSQTGKHSSDAITNESNSLPTPSEAQTLPLSILIKLLDWASKGKPLTQNSVQLLQYLFGDAIADTLAIAQRYVSDVQECGDCENCTHACPNYRFEVGQTSNEDFSCPTENDKEALKDYISSEEKYQWAIEQLPKCQNHRQTVNRVFTELYRDGYIDPKVIHTIEFYRAVCAHIPYKPGKNARWFQQVIKEMTDRIDQNRKE